MSSSKSQQFCLSMDEEEIQKVGAFAGAYLFGSEQSK
jgi:hypothetical protein